MLIPEESKGIRLRRESRNLAKETNDSYPFELLTKHDLSLDIIVKNRFKSEDHSLN